MIKDEKINKNLKKKRVKNICFFKKNGKNLFFKSH